MKVLLLSSLMFHSFITYNLSVVALSGCKRVLRFSGRLDEDDNVFDRFATYSWLPFIVCTFIR